MLVHNYIKYPAEYLEQVCFRDVLDLHMVDTHSFKLRLIHKQDNAIGERDRRFRCRA